MKTDVVILNWNGRKLLERFIPSVLQSMEGLPDVRLVVADSASEDGSQDFISETYPEVELIRLDRNYGFAGGYNRALKKLDADCFILLNSDVEVPSDWLYPLLEWMELHPECGICGPKLHRLEPEGDMFEYAGAAGGYIDRHGYPFCRGRVMGTTEKDVGQYDTPAEVLWVSGAALMIRSELYRSLGGMWEDFFAHMEEIDLCWRARLAGWKVCTVPRSTVHHLGGGSLPPSSPRKLYLNYRNNLFLMKRNLTRTMSLLLVFNFMYEMCDPDAVADDLENCCGNFLELHKSEQNDILEMACSIGRLQSRRMISRRMLLDDLSAAVYLVTFKFDCFKAVLKAHRDFRAADLPTDEAKLRNWLKAICTGKTLSTAGVLLTSTADCSNLGSGHFKLKGMWSKWTVWRYLIDKSGMFSDIREGIV